MSRSNRIDIEVLQYAGKQLLAGPASSTEVGLVPFGLHIACLHLGLSGKEGAALFYPNAWPPRYRRAFFNATTPEGRKAVSLDRLNAFIRQHGGSRVQKKSRAA